MAVLYPVMIRLEGQLCLVVGGGRVAERKVRSLLAAGARVNIVSPELT
ncbi:NAD(P)-dependent oxidoreductase, partial [Desulforudis sp. 1190]